MNSLEAEALASWLAPGPGPAPPLILSSMLSVHARYNMKLLQFFYWPMCPTQANEFTGLDTPWAAALVA